MIEDLEKIHETTLAFQSNPFLFFDDVLGVEHLEGYQRKVIQTVWDNDRTAIAACHDVGKSFLMARIAMTFLNVFPNSKVITTAPNFNQVERILWSEIRAAHAKAKWPLGGKLNTTDWTFNPEWFAIGISAKNEVTGGEGQGTQSTFQGFHAPHLLVIFDEATGIPMNVWTMAEGLMTSGHVKFVAIGNPTSSDAEFAKCFKARNWAKIYLSCFDSPNLIANGFTSKALIEKEVEKVRIMNDADALKHLQSYKMPTPYLITTKWVVESILKWGMDHPLTESKVFGKFPKASEKTLIPLGIVEEAQNRTYTPKEFDRKTIGLDVARFGIDSSVLTGLHGMKQVTRKEFHKTDAVEIVGETIAMSREMGGADIIVVDETGMGGPIVDFLRDQIGEGLPKNIEIRGVQFGASCEMEKDKEAYNSLKARMFGLLSDDMKKVNGLALLPDSVYLEELPTIRKTYNKKGQLVIESKDEYKKRTGRKSPDNADSLALANYGHYDELKIGKFEKEQNKESPKPFSGGLNSNNRNW